MPEKIILTNSKADSAASELERSLQEVRPRAIGIASAFVTVYGAKWAVEIAQQIDTQSCRLIAGKDHAITHPEALKFIADSGWEVRFGVSPAGVFHPKLLIGGERFQRDGAMRSPSIVYAGSSNLTRRGLSVNTECGYLTEEREIPGAAKAFAQMWNAARPIDSRSLADYAAHYAEINRRRSAEELEALGISDTIGSSRAKLKRLRKQEPPTRSSVAARYANGAWAGLQSFTGGYAFQVEFPRAAGQVVRALTHGRTTSGGYLDVLCEDSGQTIPMKFAFYPDNDMFRLNVPNRVPNVAWARAHHDGIAVVSQGPPGGAPIRLRIIRPGKDVDEIVRKSVGLDTWGRTSTRLYGWF
jgi:HKD family nuclease